MRFYKKSAMAFAVSASLCVSAPAAAKNIIGSIVSAEGQQINDASVSVENVDTGLEREIQSENGNFRFPLLPAGTYQVSVRKSGFQTLVQEKVNVGQSGNVSLSLTMLPSDIETIEVTGSAVALVDVSSSSTGIDVDSFTLERVPVPRDLTGVALLTPGATQGDSDFGNVPSIGGASAAENAYYINGLNITNFRTGVGSSNPPFEMYESFEIKTGGYSAEFGRVTGSVINAKTKSGTNEFKWGVNVFWEPDALRDDKPSQLDPTGDLFSVDNTGDENNFSELNLWASGALIQDKLFFYALYNPRSDVLKFRGAQTRIGDQVAQQFVKEEDKDAFWAG